ncbi:protein of unknown function [Pseudorhizobium banfieldiae]|uniref:Uncharacterized protein n=1 Tax=Pseudorhizobium banfieldiae TaxID=1125847 RepID=L0NDE5_9HYPH|nr:hypothetical protein [Pseudorhizobium banfieldiae]CAD6605866.1 hypothetical protein RNT25_01739 [arsenite-oxidising bacterium NT-25]CCF19085.1 protein of unknown function [Pseudorhizobium banfieldiae]
MTHKTTDVPPMTVVGASTILEKTGPFLHHFKVRKKEYNEELARYRASAPTFLGSLSGDELRHKIDRCHDLTELAMHSVDRKILISARDLRMVQHLSPDDVDYAISGLRHLADEREKRAEKDAQAALQRAARSRKRKRIAWTVFAIAVGLACLSIPILKGVFQ